MIRAKRVAAILLALTVAGPAGAIQAAPSLAGPTDSILTCGLEAFSESDERLFGETYAFARARSTDRDPPGRREVIGRLDSQLELCRRRERLNPKQLEIVDVYAANQMLLRGVAWHLRSQSVDMAKLDPLLERVSAVDVVENPDQAFVTRHAEAFAQAGIPARLHPAAADYLAFTRREIVFRAMWTRERPGATRPGN